MKWLKGWRWILVGTGVVLLAIISGGNRDDDDDGGQSGGGCEVEVIAEDLLNVRDGPGTDHTTVDQLEPGDVVQAQREVVDGFRKLDDDRWVATEFIKESEGCADTPDTASTSADAEGS